jgi:hypothetical protein
MNWALLIPVFCLRELETRDWELLPAAGLAALRATLAAPLGLLDETEVSSRDRDLRSRELAGLTLLFLAGLETGLLLVIPFHLSI